MSSTCQPSTTARPAKPTKRADLFACLQLTRSDVDDIDTAAIMKWQSIAITAGSLDKMHPSMFTDDELTRLDRLNDLGLLEG